jgi:hypothetical protein
LVLRQHHESIKHPETNKFQLERLQEIQPEVFCDQQTIRRAVKVLLNVKVMPFAAVRKYVR